jgi:hypothetical protein
MIEADAYTIPKRIARGLTKRNAVEPLFKGWAAFPFNSLVRASRLVL